MTKLSVNINKIALLRNSRGRNYPDVQEFAKKCLEFGAHGITLHPRPDQRHARYEDVAILKRLCEERSAELNVEGYPSSEFLEVVRNARPAQCTLVPDAPHQLTSDHGWNIREEKTFLCNVITPLKDLGIRVSLFVNFDDAYIEEATQTGADRVELYTEPYAASYNLEKADQILAHFREAALKARNAGLGVNAGHDLNLQNLQAFLSIPNILEVSIGHALIVESIDLGLQEVIRRYCAILLKALG